MIIACLQFAPVLGDVESNIKEAEEILSKSALRELDWLVLPELAFTGTIGPYLLPWSSPSFLIPTLGYNFPSLEEIEPFLEPTTAGRSTAWAVKTAKLLNCHVSVGYPEKSPADNLRYNAVVTVSPIGVILANYRKKFLYYTDETWASEGEEFFAGQLGGLGKVSMGICMDINPYKFEAPWAEYEFARAAILANSPVVVLSMAWLTTLTPEDIAAAPEKPDMSTWSYWIERFAPLIRGKSNTPTYIVMANRCGQEGKVCYAGTSTVIRIRDGSVDVYGTLGVLDKSCLVIDLESVSFESKPYYALMEYSLTRL